MMRHDRNMIPSATRPTSSSGCREFLRVIRLSVASRTAAAPRPTIHSAAVSGTPGRLMSSPTMIQGRKALMARANPAARGKRYARMPGRSIPRQLISRV
jgi:hypothetical protein